MTFLIPYDDDDRQPICPSCGITMHPLLEEGVDADECRDCGFRLPWSRSHSSSGWDDDGSQGSAEDRVLW